MSPTSTAQGESWEQPGGHLIKQDCPGLCTEATAWSAEAPGLLPGEDTCRLPSRPADKLALAAGNRPRAFISSPGGVSTGRTELLHRHRACVSAQLAAQGQLLRCPMPFSGHQRKNHLRASRHFKETREDGRRFEGSWLNVGTQGGDSLGPDT